MTHPPDDLVSGDASSSEIQRVENESADVDRADRDSESSRPEEEIAEFVREMPTEVKRQMSMVLSSGMNPFGHPIISKFNEKHVDKWLDHAREEEREHHKYVSSNRYFRLVYVLIVVALLIYVLDFYKSDPDMLVRILTLAAAFGGGIGGGYAVGYRKGREES